MLTFHCRGMGYDCTWKHTARTEDLLTDIAALHLREAHGMTELDTEMVAKIKRVVSVPGPVEAQEAEGLVLKEYSCDLGPRCTWHYIAQTEELIADGVAVHAREAHGIKEFTPAMKVKIENSLHAWKG